MAEIVTLTHIRQALHEQDEKARQLGKKARVNLVVGSLSNLRDEQGTRKFLVGTDKHSRASILEDLLPEDFM
ncbi:MAG TPA: hypothetical protein VJB96_05115 [Patescibacteria group bacterium]|nr:hypothetical protein [Patescibacteria group bacterium]